MDTQFIQSLGNPNFILYRESNIFSLGTIAKGSVVDFDGTTLSQSGLTSLGNERSSLHEKSRLE
jgi:hypothetical protein